MKKPSCLIGLPAFAVQSMFETGKGRLSMRILSSGQLALSRDVGPSGNPACPIGP
jgi:hypothetical protein